MPRGPAPGPEERAPGADITVYGTAAVPLCAAAAPERETLAAYGAEDGQSLTP